MTKHLALFICTSVYDHNSKSTIKLSYSHQESSEVIKCHQESSCQSTFFINSFLQQLIFFTSLPIDHQAYWPSWPMSLLAIKPIDHRNYRPSSLSTIEPISHRAYQPLCLLSIKPTDKQAYQPLVFFRNFYAFWLVFFWKQSQLSCVLSDSKATWPWPWNTKFTADWSSNFLVL